DANQIWIFSDAVAPTGGPPTLTVNDLTLKLYSPADTVLYKVNLGPGSCPLASGSTPTTCSIFTNPGNGHCDYYFNLDAAAAASLNNIIGSTETACPGCGDIIVLDSAITIAGGGA